MFECVLLRWGSSFVEGGGGGLSLQTCRSVYSGEIQVQSRGIYTSHSRVVWKINTTVCRNSDF